MHQLSPAVPQSSALTVLRFLGLLGDLQEVACGTSSRRLHLSEGKKTDA